MDKTISESIPIKKNLITIDEHDGLDRAFKKLFGKGVLSAPVLNEKGVAIGIISMIDIAIFAVNLAKTSQALVQSLGLPVDHPEMFIDFDAIPDSLFSHPALQESFDIDAPKFIANFSKRNPITTFSPNDTMLKLFNSFTLVSKSRRVAVTQDGSDKSPLVNFITQTDMLKFAHAHGLFDSILGKTVSQLKLGSQHVHSIKAEDRVIEAFKLFITENIEAVPVLGENGTIVGNVSAYDIRAIDATGEAIEALYWTWPQYREKMSTLDPVDRPITISGAATIGDVVEKLLKNKIHRVYVVDGTNKPVSVVSMTDLLALLA